MTGTAQRHQNCQYRSDHRVAWGNADDVRASLDGIRALAPDNLTVHTLTLKKSAPIFGAQFSSLTAEDAEALVAYGGETAAAMGMLPYYLYRQHYMLGNLANIGYAASGSASFIIFR